LEHHEKRAGVVLSGDIVGPFQRTAMNTLFTSFEIYPHRTISLDLYLIVSRF